MSKRKASVYCFSMRIIHQTHSGVAIVLVTARLFDLRVYSIGTSTEPYGFEKPMVFQCLGAGKKKAGNRI
jgi:hypothetical protein